jgi:hypothetical protein
MMIHQSVVFRNNTDGNGLLSLSGRHPVNHIEIRINTDVLAIGRRHRERLPPEMGEMLHNPSNRALY